jgi:hypothetical protein
VTATQQSSQQCQEFTIAITDITGNQYDIGLASDRAADATLRWETLM